MHQPLGRRSSHCMQPNDAWCSNRWCPQRHLSFGSILGWEVPGVTTWSLWSLGAVAMKALLQNTRNRINATRDLMCPRGPHDREPGSGAADHRSASACRCFLEQGMNSFSAEPSSANPSLARSVKWSSMETPLRLAGLHLQFRRQMKSPGPAGDVAAVPGGLATTSPTQTSTPAGPHGRHAMAVPKADTKGLPVESTVCADSDTTGYPSRRRFQGNLPANQRSLPC